MKFLSCLIVCIVLAGCVHGTDGLDDGSGVNLDNTGIADAGKAIIDGVSDLGSAGIEAASDNLIEIGSATKGPVGLAALAAGLFLYWRKRRK